MTTTFFRDNRTKELKEIRQEIFKGLVIPELLHDNSAVFSLKPLIEFPDNGKHSRHNEDRPHQGEADGD